MKAKFILALAALYFCRSLLAGDSTAAPEACRPAQPEEKSCCHPEIAAPLFTRDSLYQTDATFIDDAGKSFSLGSLRGRPVVVNMFFASCGYACPLTVTDLLTIQHRLPAELRNETVFVLVSFDVARDTTEALAKYRAQRGLDDHWLLLRGTDDSIRELAALVGVKYKQEADGAFSHSNLITILNTDGEIIHQRTGLQGGLTEAAAAVSAASK